jgi:hypothetical protein
MFILAACAAMVATAAFAEEPPKPPEVVLEVPQFDGEWYYEQDVKQQEALRPAGDELPVLPAPPFDGKRYYEQTQVKPDASGQ